MKKSKNVEILCRYKDTITNKTVGYQIKIGSEIKYVKSDDMYKLENYIINAYRTKTGEFKAKDNHKIKTEQLKNSEIQLLKPNMVSKTDNADKINGKDFIKLCREIRRRAIDGKIKVETSKHKSNEGRNIHLFEILKFCEYNIKDFVTNYLCHIQPCFLEYVSKTDFRDYELMAVNDIAYSTKMLIKIKIDKPEEYLVVSFHESNKRGVGVKGGFNINKIEEDSIVFVDSVNEYTINDEVIYRVEYTIQRGFILMQGKSYTSKYSNGCAIIKTRDIRNMLDTNINRLIENIEKNFGNGDSILLDGQSTDISFVSYGNKDINSICLLADVYSANSGNRRISGIVVSMLDEILRDIPNERLYEIKRLLENKFGKLSEHKLLKAFSNVLEAN